VGNRSPIGAFDHTACPTAVFFEDLLDCLRILRPIGGDVPVTAGNEVVVNGLHDSRLNQSTLVMPGFGPRVGKERPETGRWMREIRQQFEGVCLDHQHVVDSIGAAAIHQIAYAGSVDIDRQDRLIGEFGGQVDHRPGGAETDVDDHRSICRPGRRHVGRGKQRVGTITQGASLAWRDATAAGLEGAQARTQDR